MLGAQCLTMPMMHAVSEKAEQMVSSCKTPAGVFSNSIAISFSWLQYLIVPEIRWDETNHTVFSINFLLVATISRMEFISFMSISIFPSFLVRRHEARWSGIIWTIRKPSSIHYGTIWIPAALPSDLLLHNVHFCQPRSISVFQLSSLIHACNSVIVKAPALWWAIRKWNLCGALQKPMGNCQHEVH